MRLQINCLLQQKSRTFIHLYLLVKKIVVKNVRRRKTWTIFNSFLNSQFVIKVSFSQASRGIAEKGQKRAQWQIRKLQYSVYIFLVVLDLYTTIQYSCRWVWPRNIFALFSRNVEFVIFDSNCAQFCESSLSGSFYTWLWQSLLDSGSL